MKIHNFCRHKTTGWEGVIFEDDFGKVYITNGLGIWEENEKRMAGLEFVSSIDLPRLYTDLERYVCNNALMDLLRATYSNGL